MVKCRRGRYHGKIEQMKDKKADMKRKKGRKKDRKKQYKKAALTPHARGRDGLKKAWK